MKTGAMLSNGQKAPVCKRPSCRIHFHSDKRVKWRRFLTPETFPPGTVRCSEESSEGASAVFAEVGPGYFATMRIPLRAGRALAVTDDERAPWVAVINSSMANRYFSR